MFNVQSYQLITPLPFGEGPGERPLPFSSFPFSPPSLPIPAAQRYRRVGLRRHRSGSYGSKFAYSEARHTDVSRPWD